MPLQKGKCMVLKLPYNGRNTLHSDRSFMYHQQALHAPYGSGTCMLWLNREKEIENGELYFLFRRFVFATL